MSATNWLAANGAIRRSQPGPADMLADWNRASPALQAALARPLAARLDTFRQLRYRAVGARPASPAPARPATWPPSSRRWYGPAGRCA